MQRRTLNNLLLILAVLLLTLGVVSQLFMGEESPEPDKKSADVIEAPDN